MLQKQAFLSATQNCDVTDVLADAAYEGNVQVVQLLLDQGVSATSALKKPRDGDRSITPLHEAVRGQHVQVCHVLSEAAKYHIKTSDIVHYAARVSSGDVCEVLVNAGADVNMKNADDSTPLHWAARYQGADVCRDLIRAGANVNVTNKYGETPLHRAARAGKLRVVEVLMKNKADPYIKNTEGETALKLAEKGNHEYVAQYIRKDIPLLLDDKTKLYFG